MRFFYRVESGSMRALVWANGYRQAIRIARGFRNWQSLGLLTKVQRRYRDKKGRQFWGPGEYVNTDKHP